MCFACGDSQHLNGLTRRDFLKLSSLFTVAGALPFLAQLQLAQAAEPDAPLRIGYLPITDAAPLLVAHHNGIFEQQGLRVEKPVMFRSWAQLVEAFLSGSVNAVHMLSPMTVWARYGSKAPAKVVAWNHINGSTITTALAKNIENIEQLGGTTFAIPFWYSVHNVVLQQLFKKHGLQAIQDGEPTAKQVKLVVMAPSDMLPGLATGRISGYIVAEPFNAAAELTKVGKIWRFTGDVWKDHACCVVQMHEADLTNRPEWSQKVVNGIVQAQAWIRDHREETVKILAKDGSARYTPHTQQTLAKVLIENTGDHDAYVKSGAIKNAQWNQKRIDFQPYPYPSYTETLVKLLRETEVKGDNSFLADLEPSFAASDLVDDRFVKNAIEAIGGMKVFGQQGYTRQEVLAP